MKRNALRYVAIAAILVIAAIVIAYFFTAHNGGVVVLQLTDPPHVPAGTTSLVISYTAVQLFASNSSASWWINSSASGNLDLMKLQNFSQTIATLNIPDGTAISKVKFNISSATIEINGTMYRVTLPSNQISASVFDSRGVNGTAIILLDFSPTIAEAYAQNSTTFVLLPYVTAVQTTKQSDSSSNSNLYLQVGTRQRLDHDDIIMINRATPNITITDEVLSYAGNQISFSATVKNNANQSVDIRNVLLYGNETARIHILVPFMGPLSSNGYNYSGSDNDNGGYQTKSSGNFDLDIDQQSARAALSDKQWLNQGSFEQMHLGSDEIRNITYDLKYYDNLTLAQTRLGVIVFHVNGNGGLTLPYVGDEHVSLGFEDPGYMLSPGHSATLTFYGNTSIFGNRITLGLIPGETYRMEVVGTEGAHASANVIAGS